MNSFKHAQYEITVSLEGKEISAQINDTITKILYIGIFGSEYFRVPYHINTIYALMGKCFAPPLTKVDGADADAKEEETYRVEFNPMDSGELNVKFNCVSMSGIVNITFEMTLAEAELDLKQLSVEVSQQKKEVSDLKDNHMLTRMDLRHMGHHITEVYEKLNKSNKRAEELEQKFKLMESLCDSAFTRISELSIALDKVGQNVNVELMTFTRTIRAEQGGRVAVGMRAGDLTSIVPENFPLCTRHINIDLTKMLSDPGHSDVLREFHAHQIENFYQLESMRIFGSLNAPIQGNFRSTTVKKITIDCSRSFSDLRFVRGFPNLRELVIAGSDMNPDAVSALKSVNHHIKRLVFVETSDTVVMNQILSEGELSAYCGERGISLAVRGSIDA
jgi:hypothetical protein